MKKISVAMVVMHFPNIVQTYINSAISGLQHNDVEVSVISSSRPDRDTPFSLKGKENPKNIFYTEAHIPQLFYKLLSLPFLSLAYWKLVYLLIKKGVLKNFGIKYFIKTLVRLKPVLNNNYTVVHSHNITLSYEFLFLKYLLSLPFITTFHGKEPLGSSILTHSKQKSLFDKSDCFLVNTNFAKNSLIELGCSDKKIIILPQGTNIDNFPFVKRQINKDKQINILTVGRLSIEKGQHIAIKAIAELAVKLPNIRYHLVGDGDEGKPLKELVNTLGIQEQVIFHGYLSAEELTDIYSKAHIFILPSIDLKDGLHVETQGVVIQEAQASGIPVIASTTGGIPEIIIDKTTGLLFEESNPIDLANKISTVISDADIYKNLCLKGRKDVEDRFDSLIITAKLKSIYQSFV